MKTTLFTLPRCHRGLPTLMALVLTLASLWAQDPQVNFTLHGRWPGYPRGYASDVAVLGQYAYVACAGQILILDISNPAQPVWVKNFDSGGAVFLASSNNRVYVTRDEAGLAVLDVTQPLNPALVGTLETGYSSAKYPHGIQVLGDYAYAMWRDNNWSAWGLEVIDVRNPAQPVRTGSLPIEAQISDYHVSGNYAYVATGDGLWIVDVSNPAQPVVCLRAFRADLFRFWGGVAAAGNYAYVTVPNLGMVVLDVRDPTSPTIVSTYLASSPARDGLTIQLAGNHAYLQTDQELEVIDLSDPARPTRLGTCAGQGCGSAPGINGDRGTFQAVGDYGYFAAGPDGLQVLKLDDPFHPVRVGGFASGGGLVADQVRVVGNRAYLNDRSALHILDVSDPGHPVRLGGLEHVEHGFVAAVEISEPYAYVSATSLGNQCCTNGFFVFDVSNAAAPVRVGSLIPTELQAFQIRALGDHLIVSGWGGEVGMEGPLMFFDVRNRSQPVQVSGVRLGDMIGEMTLVGRYLYVTFTNRGDPRYSDERLAILDVSNPAAPVVVGRVPGGEGGGVAVAGQYAYVSVRRESQDDATLDGLEIFDISNPAMPVSVGACELAIIATNWPNCWPQSVRVEADYAYLTVAHDMTATLTVIDVKDPTRPQPIGTYRFQGGGYGGSSGLTSDGCFQVVGDLIYVADGAWGLTMLEVELPGTLKLKPPVLSGNTLTLSWNGGPGIRLQRTASLTAPSWQDVPNSDGASQVTLPATDAAAFFRLIRP